MKVNVDREIVVPASAALQGTNRFDVGSFQRTEPLELLLYWRSISKRKWWILAFSAVLAALSAAGVSLITPTYRATVTLLIEQSKAKLVSIEEVYSGVSANREHYQTQAEVLKSPAVARRVIEKLNLATNSEFDPRQRQVPGWLLSLGVAERPKTEWSEQTLQEAVLTDFLRRMTIEPVRLTQLVKVSFDATDPELAARVANTIAEVYIDADVQVRAGMRERATDWLAGRLTDLKQNLEASERALQQYRERENLPDTKGLVQSGAANQISELTRALNEASERRIEAEGNFKQMRQAKDPASLPLVLRSPVVERLKEQDNQAQRRLADLSQRYGPDHPRIAEAQADLRQSRENLRRAVDNVTSSYAREYQTAVENERAAARSLAAVKGQVQQMNRKEFQLDALQQDLVTNTQIYEKFVNRYRETKATSETQSGLVARVVDPAVQPGTPYKPRRIQIVAVCFLMGLLLGAIVALLLERVNTTIKSGDDVEAKLGVPTLALVPLVEGGPETRTGRYYLDEPNSVFSEAIRSARTSILLSAIDDSSKTLLVTSSVPNEGKSAFAINLALAHAQAKKTLLIEADLRRPSVLGQLGLDSTKPGLTSLFAGEATFVECLQRVEGSSLYVLPSGPIPENPLELLSSDRFKQLLTRVAAACEIVIIDSPPVHLVSDAVVLSTISTGTIFVVRAESTPSPIARRCIRALQDAGGNVMGIALNQLDFNKADRYYGSYTGYTKEYGAYYGKPA